MPPVDRLNSWCRWAVSVYPKRWAMSARLRSDHSTYRLAAEIAQARLIFIPDTPSAARRRSAVLGCKPSMRYKSATFARGNAAKKSQLSRTREGAFRMRAISPTVNPLCGLGCVARRALRDRALSKNGPRASNRLRCRLGGCLVVQVDGVQWVWSKRWTAEVECVLQVSRERSLFRYVYVRVF